MKVEDIIFSFHKLNCILILIDIGSIVHYIFVIFYKSKVHLTNPKYFNSTIKKTQRTNFTAKHFKQISKVLRHSTSKLNLKSHLVQTSSKKQNIQSKQSTEVQYFYHARTTAHRTRFDALAGGKGSREGRYQACKISWVRHFGEV